MTQHPPISPPPGTSSEDADSRLLDQVLARARQAQSRWAAVPPAHRLAVLRRFRHLLAEHAADLCATVPRPAAETLTSQIIPLADHIRFLERHAARALQPRRPSLAGRPLWLLGVNPVIHHEPLGVVLIIAPSNYPLFIPGTQLAQALAAGNAVALKPSPTGTRAAQSLASLLHRAGLEPDLIHILPPDPASASAAIQARPDKILFTGSSTTGRAVLESSIPNLIPCTLELSGADPVFVRADADLSLVTRALRFGLTLNAGATCIAPRRVFVHRDRHPLLRRLLQDSLASSPAIPIDPTAAQRLASLVNQARQSGAEMIWPESINWHAPLGPIILDIADPSLPVLQVDVFAPLLSLVPVRDDDDALTAAAHSPFALGASVFSADEAAARSLAQRINAGVVTINDLIVPSADPRVPFGGRLGSGHGVTRGLEGLLELTRIKVVAARRGRWLPHLDPAQPGDAAFFAAALESTHGASPWRRLIAGLRSARLAWQRTRTRPSKPKHLSEQKHPSIPAHEPQH